MSITLNLLNLNSPGDTIQVYRDTSPFDTDSLPDILDTVDSGLTEYVDDTTVMGTRYWYMFATVKDGVTVYSGLYETWTPPIYSGPGPQALIAGDYSTSGFYGEVLAAELIDGVDLAAELGLTSGTAQFPGEPWLKFVDRGRVIFVAKKIYRHSISWNQINSVGAALGETLIEIGSDTYMVRLMSGGNDDPATGPGGEWNRLIYPIHIADPNNQGWNINYEHSDLILGSAYSSNGFNSWCRDSTVSDGSMRICRGSNAGLTQYSVVTNLNDVRNYMGWRPVLELVI